MATTEEQIQDILKHIIQLSLNLGSVTTSVSNLCSSVNYLEQANAEFKKQLKELDARMELAQYIDKQVEQPQEEQTQEEANEFLNVVENLISLTGTGLSLSAFENPIENGTLKDVSERKEEGDDE